MSNSDLSSNMNRDFKGIWIPREIWLNKNISIQAKALWAEIWSLHDHDSGGCYASNDYLCNFLNIKLSRLKEIMKELRDGGFIIDVSFDGRNRIIRAEMPQVDYGGHQIAGKPAGRQPENRPSHSRNPGFPQYIDTTRDTTLDSPPIPPQKPKPEKKQEPAAKAAMPAKAGEKKTHRRTIRVDEHKPEVIEVQEKMQSALQSAKPDYTAKPTQIVAMKHEIDLMIRLDGRDPQKITDVFRWAVNDSFWQDKMFKPNPAKYLREKFDQLEMKMNAKPEKPKNNRRFAEYTTDKEREEMAAELEASFQWA